MVESIVARVLRAGRLLWAAYARAVVCGYSSVDETLLREQLAAGEFAPALAAVEPLPAAEARYLAGGHCQSPVVRRRARALRWPRFQPAKRRPSSQPISRRVIGPTSRPAWRRRAAGLRFVDRIDYFDHCPHNLVRGRGDRRREALSRRDLRRRPRNVEARGCRRAGLLAEVRAAAASAARIARCAAAALPQSLVAAIGT